MSPLFEDSENDLPLPSRRAAAEAAAGRRVPEIDDAHEPEREVTLNTGIVLALFFALALLCAVFFGFGYSMGRKSIPAPVVAEGDNTSATQSDADNSTSKPSPGSPVSAPVPGYAGPTPAADAKPVATPRTTPTVQPASSDSNTVPRTRPTDETTPPIPTPAPIVRVAPATGSSASSSTPVAAGTPGLIYVQVAAVSHQEDADVLLSALRRRGYTVQTRSDPNDRLTHVQLGPFTNRKDADAMRQRLAGDGYNAILK